MALTCQMIKLGRLNLHHNPPDRGGVGQIGVVQMQSRPVDLWILIQAAEPYTLEGTAATDDAVNLIAFVQQQFGEVGYCCSTTNDTNYTNEGW